MDHELQRACRVDCKSGVYSVQGRVMPRRKPAAAVPGGANMKCGAGLAAVSVDVIHK